MDCTAAKAAFTAIAAAVAALATSAKWLESLNKCCGTAWRVVISRCDHASSKTTRSTEASTAAAAASDPAVLIGLQRAVRASARAAIDVDVAAGPRLNSNASCLQSARDVHVASGDNYDRIWTDETQARVARDFKVCHRDDE